MKENAKAKPLYANVINKPPVWRDKPKTAKNAKKQKMQAYLYQRQFAFPGGYTQ